MLHVVGDRGFLSRGLGVLQFRRNASWSFRLALKVLRDGKLLALTCSRVVSISYDVLQARLLFVRHQESRVAG